MSTIARNICVNVGATVRLKIFLLDDCGDPIDAAPSALTITQPNGAILIAGDNNVPAIESGTEGIYYIDLRSVDTDQTGTYTEKWTVVINDKTKIQEFTFVVEDGADATVNALANQLSENEMIIIELDKTIADTDAKILDTTQYLYFTTKYNPYYCSTDMLRMEVGPWVEDVPEDTLALAIYWSSVEADHITCNTPVKADRIAFARSRFVMYDAAIKMLSMPISPSGEAGGSKRLGDLMVESGKLDYDIKALLQELKAEKDEWWRVLNAGGQIVPGQGLGPSYAEKGIARDDRNASGRLWHNPFTEYYPQPSVNSKYRLSNDKKSRSGYSMWNNQYYTNIRRTHTG